MNINPLNNHRILIIDDNRAIHDDFRKILIEEAHLPIDLDEDEAALFGNTPPKFRLPIFEIDSAYQGQEGLEMVEKSLWEDRPYALAFIDVRMPPGWDGVETTSKIWGKISRTTSCHLHGLFRLLLGRDAENLGIFRSAGHLEKAF